MTQPAPDPARISTWDRAAIVALGSAGCALSYDTLQQMATAIHIRGPLTFVFPLVIDGFIAYGVRALLVLRTATLAARCYVWLLFGTATAASIWANALHAVRLNQLQPEGTGLRLGDVTVGVLSTLAPLALAGAVHLYILIARRVTETEPVTAADRWIVRTEHDTGHPAQSVSTRAELGGRDETTDTGRRAVTGGAATEKPTDIESLTPSDETVGHTRDVAGEAEPDQHDRAADLVGQDVTRPRPVRARHVAKTSANVPDTGDTNCPDTRDPKSTLVTDEDLLAIARPAVDAAGRLTRQVVGNAIRGHNFGLGNDRLTELMRLLRHEAAPSDNNRPN
ncbi:DUF2637 domain-containing protein [Streptomyces sp. SDT5-1]|uniref:DUF2637 domain-containing protein n=1 Tax=Streptomyces sp. SDT5-1 TaxID=3406418 RepID=UPI003FD3CE07